MIDPGLKDKVVIVTGGNNPHGIGAATAKAFAAQGAAVFLHFFRRQVEETPALDTPGEALYYAAQSRSADAIVEQIVRQGGRATCWEADLADPAVPAELFDRAEKAFGPVDVLVNNAAACEPDTLQPGRTGKEDERGIGGLGFPMTTITAQSHDRHFAVNSRAPALLMAEFARRHRDLGRQRGRIVNVSTDGAAGFPAEVSYWASKHALESFTRAAAREFGPLGITVNVVSLGPIQTGWISPALEHATVPNIPLGRLGQPEDVADAIVLLASEQARWITGQLIYVGGGHRM
jgi:3-oxoacyl-[acyl-carrier protein] reductase